MSELNRCSPVSSSAPPTAKRVIARPSRGFVESWLGCGHTSRSLRKRLIAVLRCAHRVLGINRKALGLGSFGLGRVTATGMVFATVLSSVTGVQPALAGVTGSNGGGVQGLDGVAGGVWNNGRVGSSFNGVAFEGATDCGMLSGSGGTSFTPLSSSQIYGSGPNHTGGIYGLGAQGAPISFGATSNAGATTPGINNWTWAQTIGNFFVTWAGADGASNPTTGIANTYNVAYGMNSFATGCGSQALGIGSTAMGWGAVATGSGAAAFGINAYATKAGTLAIGTQAAASAVDSTAIGTLANAAGVSGIAIGAGATAVTDESVAIGRNASADGGKAVSIGSGNKAFGNGATAIGDPNNASGTGALALGANNIANSDGTATATTANQANGAVALGNSNVAVGPGAVAIGNTSQANNAGSVAVGDAAQVSAGATRGVALGSGSTVTHANSVALGAGSATTVGAQVGYIAYGVAAPQTSAGEVNTGNRKLTGVAAGSAATDAVNVGQLNQIAQNTATSLGGGAAYNAATGAYTPPGYSIASISATGANTGPATQTSVGVALGALNTNVGNVAGIAVKYDAAGGNTVTLGGTGGLGAPAGGVKITNLTPGTLSATSTDAINGSQLFTTNQNVATNTANIATLGQKGLQWDSTLGAFSAVHGSTTPQKITNVAAGSLSTTSTDAVNGTQLNATNENLANLGTQINNGSVGLVQQPGGAGNNLTVGADTNGGAVDFKGTAGNRRLIDVAAGTLSATSTDAVNGSQLFATNSSTAAALGGGAAINGAGGLTAPSYVLSTGTVTNVGAALSNVDAIGTKYFRANSSGASSNSTGLDAVAIGPASIAAGNSSIAVGNGAQGLSGDSIAIGRGSTAGGGQSISIGAGNSAFGNGALSLGDPNYASGTGALALGANNVANNDGTNSATAANLAQGAVALGNQNVAVGQGSVAIGNTSKANNAGSVAIGDSAAVSNAASQGVALGSGAAVTHARSVALGARSATTVGAEAGYVAYGIAAPQTSTGEVNIGNRKLTGLAAGSTATDAVNVSQLNQIAQNTATSLGGGAAYNTATGAYTAPSYSIASISATGASTGSTTQTNVGGALTALGTNVGNVAGIAVKYDSAGGSIITLGATGGTGAPASGVRITNLTAGALSTASTDAVNGAQLFTTNQNLTSLSNQINSGSVGLVQQPGGTGSNLTVGAGTAGEAVDFKGTAGNRKLIDVAAGTVSATSTDAVIGSQLFATNQNVATNTASIATLGQNALQWDPALGAFSAVHGSTTPQKITNVAAGTLSVTATDAVNGSQLFTTNQNVTNLSNQISSGAVGLVQQPGGPGNNLTVGAGTDGGVVDFKGTAGNRKLIDVAAGSLSATSTDAVNGSQLFATNQSIAAVGQNALQWDPTLGAFSAVHGSAVPRKVTNLAAGALSAASADAVNGSQLFTTNQTVTTLGSSAASALGGTTAYNPLTGQLTGGFAYSGSSFGSVQSVFDAINTSINGGAGIKYVHVASTKADSQATGTDSIGIGPASVASGGSSIAIGNGAQGQSTNAIAIGTSATARGGAAVSIGAGNSAFGNGAVALGDPNFASGTGAFVAGANSIANSDGSNSATAANQANGAVAIGNANRAIGQGSVALGNTSAANNAGSVAIGDSANVGAAASKGVALGSGSSVTGANSVAIGAGSTDGGQANVVSFGAVGAERKIINVADGTLSANSTEVVNGRQLFQTNRSVASLATQINNGSVGLVRQAAPGADLTVGAMTDGGAVNFQGSAGDRKLTHVAAGAVSAASTDAVNGAQLNATNQAVAAVNKLSVKYVADSSGNPTNTVTLVGAGNGQAVKITNVANGVAPTDAVNVRQLQALGESQISYDTNPDGTQNHTSLTFNRGGAAAVLHNVGPAVLGTDAVNLNQLAATAAADRSYTDTQVGGLRNDMSRGFAMLDNRISGVQKEERQGIAAAMAMTSSPMPSAPGKTTWAANTALFKREVGLGASFAHRFASAIPIAFTGGVSWAGNDNLGARVGLMGEF
ncbi:hypothetical protein [Bradyrhizobium brasilense]|uniref:hypothetical protein n=1 Tax=Bradyrhizobium brasilense TaxID=1419277 RepID=UPI001457772A|nr:hypothetical protein [Bradyrhizobium brasilense]